MGTVKAFDEWFAPEPGQVYLIHNETEPEMDRWQLFKLHRIEENRFYVLEGFLLRDDMPYRRPMSVNRSYRSRQVSQAFVEEAIPEALEEHFPQAAPLLLMALKRVKGDFTSEL